MAVFLAAAVIIAVAAVTAVAGASKYSGITVGEVSSLEVKTLENNLSVSGIVESKTFKQVSANLAYNVDEVSVEVGDKVRAGDILAILDSDDLQRQIVEQQASLDNANINTDYSLSNAEKRYNETKMQIEDGSYPEIRNAKLSLDNSENNLSKATDNAENARENYENVQRRYREKTELSGSDKQTRINSAQKNVESARYEMDIAKQDLDDASAKCDEEDYSDIKELKKAYDDAKKDYDSRYDSSNGEEISKAREEYENALSAYSYSKAYAADNPSDLSAQENMEYTGKILTEKENRYNELCEKYNVERVTDTYEKAMTEYNRAKADIDTAHNNSVKSAERAYNRAKSNYEAAVDTLENVKNDTDASLDSYRDAADNAERALEDAERSLSDARKAVDDEKKNYETAQKNAQSTLASLKAEADREKVLSENDAGIISLELLKQKLDDCVITAPCSGTVTAVYAVPGAPASGTLFLIEDTDDLKMTAVIREYNITDIYEGLEVTVSIPSMDNMEFEGVLDKIAPAGVKGADGKSDGTASFKVEILIKDTKDTGVLIGMTSKCTAVTEKKENVIAVGYDAVAEDENGDSYIYTYDMTDSAEGLAVVRRIPVELGFETETEVEISSPEISAGMRIITNSSDVSDGDTVRIHSDDDPV